jgi:hypothetical protein
VDSFTPDTSPETLAARILEETAHTAPGAIPPTAGAPMKSHPEFVAIDDAAHFHTIERLLQRVLEKTELETESAKALDRLNPKLRDCNLLLLETLNNFFEGYRALRYQTSILTRTVEQMRKEIDSLQQALIDEQQRTAEPES